MPDRSGMSRRDFLRGFFATGAALVFSGIFGGPKDARAERGEPLLEKTLDDEKKVTPFDHFLVEHEEEYLKGLDGEDLPVQWKELLRVFADARRPYQGEIFDKADAQFGALRETGPHPGVDTSVTNVNLFAPIGGRVYGGWDTPSHENQNPYGGMGLMCMLCSDETVTIDGKQMHPMLVFGHMDPDGLVGQWRDGSSILPGAFLRSFGMSGNTQELHAHVEMWLIERIPDDYGRGDKPIVRPEGTIVVDPTLILEFLLGLRE